MEILKYTSFRKVFENKGNVQCELLVEEEKYTDLSSKKVLYTSECGTGILLKMMRKLS